MKPQNDLYGNFFIHLFNFFGNFVIFVEKFNKSKTMKVTQAILEI